MFLILVTGDRNWRDPLTIQGAMLDAVEEVVPWGEEVVFMHGFARGADYECDVIAHLLSQYGQPDEQGRYIKGPLAIPANWREHGRAAGPIRNQAMLERGPQFVLGFHNDIASSRGTADMLRRCKRAGVPGRLYTEEGMVEEWH